MALVSTSVVVRFEGETIARGTPPGELDPLQPRADGDAGAGGRKRKSEEGRSQSPLPPLDQSGIPSSNFPLYFLGNLRTQGPGLGSYFPVNQNPTHIAVIDDDPSVLRALGHLLRSRGFEAGAFDCAEAFLEELALPDARAFDCALIDAQMPGMPGIDLQARLLETHPTLPVILFSAHDDPTVRECALAAGAVAFLRKPITEEALFESIAKSLARANDP